MTAAETHTCYLCGREGPRQFLRDRVEGKVVWKCASYAACRDRQMEKKQ